MSTDKDYLHGDNSDIIATDSQKNTVYVLAKKFGIKSVEDFGILLCNHFLSKYSHVTKVVIHIDEMLWNRIAYSAGNAHMQHNHAFVHAPVSTRTTTVKWVRNGKNFPLQLSKWLDKLLSFHFYFSTPEYFPKVISGLKNMRILKTTQSSFVNFVADEYRTLPDMEDRIFSTVVDCQWEYRRVPDINYDKSFETIKQCILHNFAGDLDKGIPSPSVQHTLYEAEKEALESIPSIDNIEMTMPNVHYVNFDFSKFQGLEGTSEDSTVYLPLDKPSGTIYGKLDRRQSKLWGWKNEKCININVSMWNWVEFIDQ